MHLKMPNCWLLIWFQLPITWLVFFPFLNNNILIILVLRSSKDNETLVIIFSVGIQQLSDVPQGSQQGSETNSLFTNWQDVIFLMSK